MTEEPQTSWLTPEAFEKIFEDAWRALGEMGDDPRVGPLQLYVRSLEMMVTAFRVPERGLDVAGTFLSAPRQWKDVAEAVKGPFGGERWGPWFEVAKLLVQ